MSKQKMRGPMGGGPMGGMGRGGEKAKDLKKIGRASCRERV